MNVAKFISRLISVNTLTVLTYHRIGEKSAPQPPTYLGNISATPDMFDRQMQYVAQHFNVIDLETLRRFVTHGEVLPANPLLITFDDGYLDNYTHAFPILKKHNLPAVIFLITGQIENPIVPWWDACTYIFATTHTTSASLPVIGRVDMTTRESKMRVCEHLLKELKKLPEQKKKAAIACIQKSLHVDMVPQMPDLFMTWNQVRELVRHRVCCQPHTANHPILANINRAEAIAELATSRDRIVQETCQEAFALAYPNGTRHDYCAETIQALRATRYEMAFTMERGPMAVDSIRNNPYEIRRIFMAHWDSFDIFRSKVHGLLRHLPLI